MTTVLISGANRGIGLELARQYAAESATVIAGVRDPEAADALKAVAGVEVHQLDVTDDQSVQAFKTEIGERPIDILIANAGVGGGREHLGAFDFANWSHTFDVNTFGPVRLAEALLSNVKAGGDKKLVAITSSLGSTAAPGGDMFAYRASKAALNNAWVGLAEVLKRDGVVCLLLHPGWVQTDMGGPHAQITVDTSAKGLRQRIGEAGPKQSGTFQAYDGRVLPW